MFVAALSLIVFAARNRKTRSVNDSSFLFFTYDGAGTRVAKYHTRLP